MPTDTPRTANPRRHITPAEVARAVYLDFESFQDQQPALVGYQIEDHLHQVVTDAVLAPAARAKDLRVATFEEIMTELVRVARQEHRRIVAYSEHEMHVTREFSPVDLEPFYADGRRILKRWWNRLRPFERPREWTLAEFERCAGIERPKHLRCGHATARLRFVRDQLAARGRYEKLTRTAKAKWTKLLAYNELDVRNLRTLVMGAAHDPQEAQVIQWNPGPSIHQAPSHHAR
jgi:hypothetical protein